MVKVSKVACSGCQHFNSVLLATLGTYHGDNRLRTLSTKRMRTFLSRHTRFPSFGLSVLTFSLPSQMIFQKSSGHPSTEICTYFLEGKLFPLCLAWEEIIFIFLHKRACMIYKVRKVAWIIPSWGSPLTWRLLPCTSRSAPSSKISGNMQYVFPVPCTGNFRIKKHHSLPMS